MNPLALIALIFVGVAAFNLFTGEKHETFSETHGDSGGDLSSGKQGGDHKRNNRSGLRKKTVAVGKKKEKSGGRKTHSDARGSGNSDSVGVEPVRSDKRGEPIKESEPAKEGADA